ncbi:MAG: hypothetical protein RML48_08265, partial [Candidatus Bipolaricaulota bacterium]|nr:hypothetical protein [Candidatus Bipolaricaulota bacterium]
LLAVVLVALCSTVVYAEPTLGEQAPAQLNFGRLWLSGSLGALVGGVGGAVGAYLVCINLTPRGPWADLVCLAGSLFYGYLPGVPIGATIGVSLSGARQQVRGNVGMAALGAVLGGAAAVALSQILANSLLNQPGWQSLQDFFVPFFLFIGVPASAGWGAAWGYSMGAKPVEAP